MSWSSTGIIGNRWHSNPIPTNLCINPLFLWKFSRENVKTLNNSRIRYVDNVTYFYLYIAMVRSKCPPPYPILWSVSSSNPRNGVRMKFGVRISAVSSGMSMPYSPFFSLPLISLNSSGFLSDVLKCTGRQTLVFYPKLACSKTFKQSTSSLIGENAPTIRLLWNVWSNVST